MVLSAGLLIILEVTTPITIQSSAILVSLHNELGDRPLASEDQVGHINPLIINPPVTTATIVGLQESVPGTHTMEECLFF